MKIDSDKMDAKQKQRLRVKLASIGAKAERHSAELNYEIAKLNLKLDSLRHELSMTQELNLTAVAMLNGKLPIDMTEIDLLKKASKM